MIFSNRSILLYCCGLFASLFCSVAVTAESPDIAALLQQVDAYPHTQQVEFSEREVIDYEVGLGAIQKIRGEWHFKESERLSGTLLSYTWLMDTGFSASDVMAQLLDSVADTEGATELFTCDGRACGRAVQWANRVFKQRILFGREDLQRYRVYGFEGTPQARLLIYSAERTADRQYLHVEWLVISP
mgnify:CR=1 FL=1|tara:strand:+ start:718 stop:1278 length:561 start_codon:yes stop_codon:yes gene_type:complete